MTLGEASRLGRRNRHKGRQDALAGARSFGKEALKFNPESGTVFKAFPYPAQACYCADTGLKEPGGPFTRV